MSKVLHRALRQHAPAQAKKVETSTKYNPEQHLSIDDLFNDEILNSDDHRTASAAIDAAAKDSDPFAMAAKGQVHPKLMNDDGFLSCLEEIFNDEDNVGNKRRNVA